MTDTLCWDSNFTVLIDCSVLKMLLVISMWWRCCAVSYRIVHLAGTTMTCWRMLTEMSSCQVLLMCHFVSMWWRCWTETYMVIPFEAVHTCWQSTYRVVSLPSLENAPRDTDVILLFSSDLEKIKWQPHRLCWATHIQWGQIAEFCKRSAWYRWDGIIVQRPMQMYGVSKK